VLCGEILLDNGIGFHEVSYERFRVQPSRRKKKAGQIEKETNERRTSNIQRRIMYSVELNKKTEQVRDNITLNGEP
jgi:hypothetical protein